MPSFFSSKFVPKTIHIIEVRLGEQLPGTIFFPGLGSLHPAKTQVCEPDRNTSVQDQEGKLFAGSAQADEGSGVPFEAKTTENKACS